MQAGSARPGIQRPLAPAGIFNKGKSMPSSQARVDEFNLDHRIGTDFRKYEYGGGAYRSCHTLGAAFVDARGQAVVRVFTFDDPVLIDSLKEE